MAWHWLFLVAKPFLPNLADPFEAGLGGTEQALLHLGRALVAAGDQVTIAGGSAAPSQWGGISWLALTAAASIRPNAAVAINDARLLDLAGGGLPMVWFHNEVTLAREVRRLRLGALRRHQPLAVFIGTEQARLAPRLLPFRERFVIPYGLSNRILGSKPPAGTPGPNALFTSQAYRGLAEVLQLWQRDISPVLPEARFTAFIAASDVRAYRDRVTKPGISLVPRVGRDAVYAALAQSRVLLAPGHAAETFCLAAAEALALGVPVVTLGIGSLKERVRDGVDGFVCRDVDQMAGRTRALLTDDTLWRRLHTAGLESRTGRDWGGVAAQWRAILAETRT